MENLKSQIPATNMPPSAVMNRTEITHKLTFALNCHNRLQQ